MLSNLSFWEKTTYLSDIDFAVIGSGIVGLNAAISYKQQRPSAKVVVFERGVFPMGASTKNAGFACFGSVSELLADLEIMGEEQVLSLVAKRWQGLQRLRAMCGDQSVDYQSFGGYELFLEADDFYHKCAEAIPYLNQLLSPVIGAKTIFEIEKKPSKFGFGKVKKLIYNQFEGQLNPAKMMDRLSFIAHNLNIKILTGVNIFDIVEDQQKVQLGLENGWAITAAKVLVATNGFTKKLLPDIALQPARNQVLITKPISNLALRGTFHFDHGYYYFRNFENRILLGGARNIAKVEETTPEFGLTPVIQDALTQFLTNIILPNQTVEIDHQWSGILGVGEQKTPIILQYSKNIGVAVRLGGMGVAIGSLVGEKGAKLFL